MPVRRYYERKPLIRLFLRSVDFVTDGLAWLLKKKSAPEPANPPKILVLSFGHLGDTLILSYVFPVIKEKYPGAVIDLVVGSWCNPVLATNPNVRRVINIEHLVANRRRQAFPVRVWAYWRSFWQAIPELRREWYDYSIDIRHADPPSHFILPFIRVKKSIGMGTRRFGGLLDKAFYVPPIGSAFHHFAVSEPLFRELGIDVRLETVRPVFQLPKAPTASLAERLGRTVTAEPIILLFPETGEPRRHLSAVFWEQLTTRLLKETSATLILCGQQQSSAAIFQHIPQTHPSSRLVDAVGKLSLTELATLAGHARLAFTLESMPAHLCAVFCPVIAFFKNGTGAEFFPIGNFPVTVVHNHKASQHFVVPRPGFEQRYSEAFETPEIVDFIIQKAHSYYATVYRL